MTKNSLCTLWLYAVCETARAANIRPANKKDTNDGEPANKRNRAKLHDVRYRNTMGWKAPSTTTSATSVGMHNTQAHPRPRAQTIQASRGATTHETSQISISTYVAIAPEVSPPSAPIAERPTPNFARGALIRQSALVR